MTDEIRLTQPIRAERGVVWSALSTAAGLMGWQADEVHGEPEAGEHVELAWPLLGVTLGLDVVERVEGRRLVFEAGPTRLCLALVPGGLELVHSGVGEGDERAGVTSSWVLSLGILAHFCETHPGARRSVRWLLAPAKTSAEAAHVFFTEPAALRAWLGEGDGIGSAGSRYAVEMGGGEHMSGHVLANSLGRDVAVSWDEDEESVLVLRTLPRPLSPDQRLVVMSWSRWSRNAPPAHRAARLEAAHHHLVRALHMRSEA